MIQEIVEDNQVKTIAQQSNVTVQTLSDSAHLPLIMDFAFPKVKLLCSVALHQTNLKSLHKEQNVPLYVQDQVDVSLIHWMSSNTMNASIIVQQEELTRK